MGEIENKERKGRLRRRKEKGRFLQGDVQGRYLKRYSKEVFKRRCSFLLGKRGLLNCNQNVTSE